jgi:tetratricopeptide (TPR) repeat protein
VAAFGGPGADRSTVTDAVRRRVLEVVIMPMQATDYLEKGLKQAAQMDYDDAIQTFDEALGLDPDLVDVYYNRGLIYSRLGYHAAAINDFSRVLSIGGDRPRPNLPQDLQVMAYCYRAQARHYLNQSLLALEDCNRALDIDFYCAQAYQRRGLVRLDLGLQQEALEDLQTAVHIAGLQGDSMVQTKAEKLIQALF